MRSHFGVHFPAEAEKKREAKQRAKEAQERELRKREKAEEKERRRKEYDALKAARREQEKKPRKETNQAPSTCWQSQGSSWGAAGAAVVTYSTLRPREELGGCAGTGGPSWGAGAGLLCRPRATRGRAAVRADAAGSAPAAGSCPSCQG